MVRGETRPLPVSANEVVAGTVDAKLNASIHNRFDVEVIDSRTGEVRQRAQAENIILDQLWAKLMSSGRPGSSDFYFNNIHFGKGSGVPTPGRTSLFSFIDSRTATNPVYDRSRSAEGIISCRKKIVLTESEYIGETLSEIGISNNYAQSDLCTHAMLKDMNGNTITIAKTNTDIIHIYATIFLHFNPNGYGGSIFIMPRSPFILWLLGCGETLPTALAYSKCSSLAYISEFTPYKSQGNNGYVVISYAFNAQNKTITGSAGRLPADSNNVGGFCSLLIGYGRLLGGIWNLEAHRSAAMCLVDDSWYPGSAIVSESIGTGDGATKDFCTKFPNATNLKVYVNGIQDALVSITYPPTNIDNLGADFDCIDENKNKIWGPVPGGGAMYNFTDHSKEHYSMNPNYLLGVDSFVSRGSNVFVSDDFITWVKLKGQDSLYTETLTNIDPVYRNFRYWKVDSVLDSATVRSLKSNTIVGNIHFTTPPPASAIITADYFTKTIAKDENHVFDFSLTIQLGEYTPTV